MSNRKMTENCKTAVRLAAKGGMVSQTKMQAIEDALSGKMRELARTDPLWQSYSPALRMGKALDAAKAQLAAEAARKVELAQLQALRMADSTQQIQAQRALNNLTQSQGLIRFIDQAERDIRAVQNESMGHLGDLIAAVESKDGTGIMRNLGMRLLDMDNPAMTADVVREIWRNGDGHTGNRAAQAGAKAWLEVIEALRLRFNASGGDIGKLGYGYLTQTHDAVRVFEAGAPKWVDSTYPLLDRSQYLREDGAVMSEAEVRSMLAGAWETLGTGGSNKTEPGAFRGTGARANKGSETRVLHFKDGDAWMTYMKEYGQGGLYDAMTGHVAQMARNIGLVEKMGPNPEQWFRVQKDIAERADGAGTFAGRAAGNTPQAYWDITSGKAGMPENRLIAQVAQDVSNIQTAAKLGGAVLTSLTDIGTIATTLHFNRLPYFDMVSNLGKQFDGDTREFLRLHGIMGESMSNAVNKWTGDNLTHSLTGRVAGSVMKLSLMNAWTDGLRGAFSMTMMGGLARMSRKAWGELDEWDRYLLQRKGITEADWAVVQQAQLTPHNGTEFLTADSVRATGLDGAEQAATKVLSFVIDEAQFAVVNPDLATRAIVSGGGLQRGTVRGEAMRSFAQFKSFPVAMLTRHWRRAFETPQGLEGAPMGFGAESSSGALTNRIGSVVALSLTGMLLGAIVLQNKAILQGKDPFNMTEGRFWMRALSQGGGFGYLGDLLFKDPTETRGNSVEQTVGVILGPTSGAIAGFGGDLIVKNVWEAALGKDTDAGAEALKWATSQVPFQSLWYTRGLIDRAFMQQAQEALNPGYLGRMEGRAKKDWGQEFYWRPGETAPDRAPDLSRAFGQ